jgi:hypothetical protein
MCYIVRDALLLHCLRGQDFKVGVHVLACDCICLCVKKYACLCACVRTGVVGVGCACQRLPLETNCA